MPNPSHQKALNDYQSALEWMHEGKFEKARLIFEKLSQEGPVEILERSKVYLVACQRRVQQSGLSFDSTEEQYDYAISLLNTGFYEEARDQFLGILKINPTADYAYYGLAILAEPLKDQTGFLILAFMHPLQGALILVQSLLVASIRHGARLALYGARIAPSGDTLTCVLHNPLFFRLL